MSKRQLYTPENTSKRLKLNITRSENHFPLSQNQQLAKEDTWGDDNEDEILLLASQAVEDAAVNDSILPDYSQFKAPSKTSTQFPDKDIAFSKNDPDNELQINFPSTSGTFKQPLNFPNNSIKSLTTTKQTDFNHNTAKANGVPNRIQSPLQGLNLNGGFSNVKEAASLSDENLVFKGTSSSEMHSELSFYKRAMELQKENEKLKSENGKLLDKCLTKDGEASILRAQLKTSQQQLDGARLEKLKHREKYQIEYNDKLNVAHGEVQNLKTQIEFQNMEMINMKERYKMLDSNKIKLRTPVGDINMSQRLSSPFQSRKTDSKVQKNTEAQTDWHRRSLHLGKVHKTKRTILHNLPATIFEPTNQDDNSVVIQSESLNECADISQSTCRVYSVIHKSTLESASNKGTEDDLKLSSIYEELSALLHCTNEEFSTAQCIQKCIKIGKICKNYLNNLLDKLEDLSKRVSPKLRREMDKRYLDYSRLHFPEVCRENLFEGRYIFPGEKAIDTRRIVAVVATLCTVSQPLIDYLFGTWHHHSDAHSQTNNTTGNIRKEKNCIEIICEICNSIGYVGCTNIFSGFLLSVNFLIEVCLKRVQLTVENRCKLLFVAKAIVMSRPISNVLIQSTKAMRFFSLDKVSLESLCSGEKTGNLKLDIDHGVNLYSKDSCFLQILINQLENVLKVLEQYGDAKHFLDLSHNVVIFYKNTLHHKLPWSSPHSNSSCNCPLRLLHILIVTFRIAASMYKEIALKSEIDNADRLAAIIRSGLLILNLWKLHNFSSQLEDFEGHFQYFIELCEELKDEIITDEIQLNILNELVSITQTNLEDSVEVSPSTKQLWEDSFAKFTITD